jgi:hypothetical protein
VTSIRPTPPRMVPAATSLDPGGPRTTHTARSFATVTETPGRSRRTVVRAVMATDLALVAAVGSLGVAVLPWFGTAHPLDGGTRRSS